MKHLSEMAGVVSLGWGTGPRHSKLEALKTVSEQAKAA